GAGLEGVGRDLHADQWLCPQVVVPAGMPRRATLGGDDGVAAGDLAVQEGHHALGARLRAARGEQQGRQWAGATGETRIPQVAGLAVLLVGSAVLGNPAFGAGLDDGVGHAIGPSCCGRPLSTPMLPLPTATGAMAAVAATRGLQSAAMLPAALLAEF